MSGGGPTCPWCDKEHDYPDEWPRDEDERVERECSCGKTFTYSVSWSPDFTEYKAECLNGGEHVLCDCITYGHPGGPHKYQECIECGETIYPPTHPESREARAARKASNESSAT